MEPRISIITLGVSDLQRAIRFYRDGLRLLMRDTPGDDIAFFETSSTWLALFPRANLAGEAAIPDDGQGFKGFTLAHNVRTRTEVDQVLSEAESAGAVITRPAKDASWGGYSGYFSDPDGFIWEVAWNPQFWIE